MAALQATLLELSRGDNKKAQLIAKRIADKYTINIDLETAYPRDIILKAMQGKATQQEVQSLQSTSDTSAKVSATEPQAKAASVDSETARLQQLQADQKRKATEERLEIQRLKQEKQLQEQEALAATEELRRKEAEQASLEAEKRNRERVVRKDSADESSTDDDKRTSSNKDRGKGKRSKSRRTSGYRDKLSETPIVRRQNMRRSGAKRSDRSEQTSNAPKVVQLPSSMTVSELAKSMSVKLADVTEKVHELEGVIVTSNSVIAQDTCMLVVEALGHTADIVELQSPVDQLNELLVYKSEAKSRPPIITIMGHVDHGKTSLIDKIRETDVVSGESGGITQHIGAYSVQVGKKKDKQITVLDTPGHQAFSNMRARGAQVTDIVVLVVAANDAVMPQTLEAIEHARQADVPIVVAINKIDVPNADINQVRKELSAQGIADSEWGGEQEIVEISALQGKNINTLLEAVLLEAEVLELKAHSEGPAQGAVIEAKVDKGRGPVATIILSQGNLKRGDRILIGTTVSRVRALVDHNGKTIKEAVPGIPVEVVGLDEVPQAGDSLVTAIDDKLVRQVIDYRINRESERRSLSEKMTVEQLFESLDHDPDSEVRLVLKTDVRGSLEAIEGSLQAFKTDDTDIKIVSSGIGGISESDIALAKTANALCVGFNVRADATARKLADETQVEFRYYSIIYELIEDIQQMLEGMLTPERHEEIVGTARVLEVFRSSRFGQVAGCVVEEGTIKRELPVRVLRDNVVIFEGKLNSLRRVRDDVDEVQSGTECGLGIKDYLDIQPSDHIEVFSVNEVRRKLKVS